jgi:menaquinol-cytochrome c reductase iron-sulfur subunit
MQDRASGPAPSGEETAARRRRFLQLWTAVAGGAAALLAIGPPLAFLFWPVRRRPVEEWVGAGLAESFPPGETVQVRARVPGREGWSGPSAHTAFYVRRDGEDAFTAFSMYCTHTGCPVRWVPGANLFLCPCHGGAFSRDGAVVSGPPPRPLERLPVRVRDGNVEVMPTGVPLEG